MPAGTAEHDTSLAEAVQTQAVAGASATDEQDSAGHTSKAMEMSNLNSPSAEPNAAPSTTGVSAPQAPTEAKPSASQPSQPPPAPDLNRSETAELALGPDGAQPAPNHDPSVPALRITLMLTTGARHAYIISQKYLTSRKVTAVDASGAFDPREMSGYKLKELIWTDWRAEWEARPRDPSSIRLIIMGRMIDDKVALKGMFFRLATENFPTAPVDAGLKKYCSLTWANFNQTSHSPCNRPTSFT